MKQNSNSILNYFRSNFRSERSLCSKSQSISLVQCAHAFRIAYITTNEFLPTKCTTIIHTTYIYLPVINISYNSNDVRFGLWRGFSFEKSSIDFLSDVRDESALAKGFSRQKRLSRPSTIESKPTTGKRVKARERERERTLEHRSIRFELCRVDVQRAQTRGLRLEGGRKPLDDRQMQLL